MVEFLGGLNFGLMALSNNHSWNLSGDGVRSTIKAAGDQGITYAGTGEDIGTALGAGVREVAGRRVGLIASATVRLTAAAAAGDEKPGINLMRLGNAGDWDRDLRSVREAADSLDVLLVYQHFQIGEEDVAPGNEFGHEATADLDAWQRDWARAVIDAGASLYVAHGSREFQGVEVYRNRPILHGLGNFIFHSGQPAGHYEHDVWESVIATVTFVGNEPSRIDFIPIVLDEGSPGEDFLQRRGVPEVASGELGASILSRLSSLSAEFGTILEVSGGQTTLVIWP